MATATASQPAPAASKNFVFINDTRPGDSKSTTKRKLVRAQAARGPHSNTANGAQDDSKPTPNKHQASRRKKKERTAATTFPLSLVGLEDLQTPVDSAIATGKVDRVTIQVKQVSRVSSEESIEGLSEEQRQTSSSDDFTVKKPNSTNSDESPPGNASTALVPKMPGTGWVAPFIPHPDPEKPYIPMLVNHYLSNLAVNIPELDAGTPFILRHKWFPMVITSPATLYIVLLTAASHFAAFNDMLPREEIQMILLNLKQRTLTSINEMIRDRGSKPMCDTIIGAVAKMASYEAMFGSPQLYHTHMRGLQNMIEHRGGLHMLGLDGLLERMVLWIDINSAFLLNSQAYFLPTKPLAGQTGFLQPNPGHFLGAS